MAGAAALEEPQERVPGRPAPGQARARHRRRAVAAAAVAGLGLALARGCGPGGGIALASQGFAVAPAALHLPAAGGPVAGRVLKHGRRRRPAGAPPRQRRLGTRGRAQRRREGSASAQRPIQRALGRWAAPAVAALLAASAFALPAWAADAGAPVLDIDWSVGRVAKFLAAGGSCASISHAIAVPLDVVKTRHQYDPDRYLHEVTGKPLGIFETGYRITRQEGSLMLLQGLRATSVGYLIQGATKYTLWEFFKALFGLGSAATAASRVAILVAAALLAEVIATVVLCPFERARIKLVSDPTFAPSTVSAFARLAREDGIYDGFYGNLGPTLVKQGTYTIGKLTTFSLAFDFLMGRGFGLPRPAVTLAASVVAGLVASVVSQPGDMLQICTSSNSKLAAQCPIDINTGRRPGLFKLMVLMGPKKLFTGWRARLLQIEVIVVTQLLIYDGIKSFFGL